MGELEYIGGDLVPVENMPNEFSSALNSAFAALVFIAPRSKRWRVVKSALNRLPHKDNDKDFLVLFKQTQDDLELLMETLYDVSGWKTAYLFINGKRRNASDAHQWLSCFLSSLKSGGPETYCPGDMRCHHYRHGLSRTCSPD